MFGKTLPIVAMLWVMAPPLSAADGILIVETSSTNGARQTNRIQIEKTRMRVETAMDGRARVVTFDGRNQVMRVIDMKDRSYFEVTKALIDDQVPGETVPAVTLTEYRRNGTDRVGKWICDRYDGLQNGKKVSEVCTVDPKAFGLNPADFDVSVQLARFFERSMPQRAGQMFAVGGERGLAGVPVRRTYNIGREQAVSELTAVSRVPFADATFEVPSGFVMVATPGVVVTDLLPPPARNR